MRNTRRCNLATHFKAIFFLALLQACVVLCVTPDAATNTTTSSPGRLPLLVPTTLSEDANITSTKVQHSPLRGGGNVTLVTTALTNGSFLTICITLSGTYMCTFGDCCTSLWTGQIYCCL